MWQHTTDNVQRTSTTTTHNERVAVLVCASLHHVGMWYMLYMCVFLYLLPCMSTAWKFFLIFFFHWFFSWTKTMNIRHGNRREEKNETQKRGEETRETNGQKTLIKRKKTDKNSSRSCIFEHIFKSSNHQKNANNLMSLCWIMHAYLQSILWNFISLLMKEMCRTEKKKTQHTQKQMR